MQRSKENHVVTKLKTECDEERKAKMFVGYIIVTFICSAHRLSFRGNRIETNSFKNIRQAWESSTEHQPNICTGKVQRASGGQEDKQPEVGWFPWHLRERPLYSRPLVTPCDEAVQINPPFHPTQCSARVEAALMDRIHTRNPLFDYNMFGTECMRALGFQTCNTEVIKTELFTSREAYLESERCPWFTFSIRSSLLFCVTPPVTHQWDSMLVIMTWQ